MKNIVINTLAIVALIVGCYAVFNKPFDNVQGAGIGTQSRVLYATTTGIGLGYQTVSPAKDYCAGRAITATTTLYVSFDATMAPSITPARGVYQATGTTMYDSSLYGCGAITAIAPASTTVTVTEFVY